MSDCWRCKEPLYGRRVVIGGWAYCSDCAYELEYGAAKRLEPPPPLPTRPQDETLFDATVYVRKRRR
jgi:hypothetical protein